MTRIAVLLLTLIVTCPAFAQSRQIEQEIEQICDGPVLASISSKDAEPRVKNNSGKDFDPVDPLQDSPFVPSAQRLVPIFQATYPSERLIVVLSASQQINAWAVGSWKPHNHLVCVPIAFAEFMGNEDELAFMIGHEIGHTRDPEPLCGSYRSYTQLNREQKTACESRADEIGYWFLRQAGYSPYAAAGGFGRLEMYSGDTQTGIMGILRQLSIDHPITPKRIENMRHLLINESRAAR